ncbi:MAG: hypothetical protein WKF82_02875 [Nocardioidaceae bacterium]
MAGGGWAGRAYRAGRWVVGGGCRAVVAGVAGVVGGRDGWGVAVGAAWEFAADDPRRVLWPMRWRGSRGPDFVAALVADPVAAIRLAGRPGFTTEDLAALSAVEQAAVITEALRHAVRTAEAAAGAGGLPAPRRDASGWFGDARAGELIELGHLPADFLDRVGRYAEDFERDARWRD